MSKYRGVCWHKANEKWLVRIKVAGRSTTLGLFADEAKAAQAYDRAARARHGKKARLNFPKEGENATSTSKYRGVNLVASKKWVAKVQTQGKLIYLGTFDKEIDAAKRFDEYVYEAHGENARLNFSRVKENKAHTSKYRGVCWNKQTDKWLCRIKVQGKLIYLGHFAKGPEGEIKAAQTYDAAARERHGDRAQLNFPDKDAGEAPAYTSKYRGVHYNKKDKLWIARVRKGKVHLLGRFENEEQAARAYDEAARKFFGAAANVNFPAEVMRDNIQALEKSTPVPENED